MDARAFGITYLSAEVLAPIAPVMVTISDVSIEEVGEDREPKMVVRFLAGLPDDLAGKGLILNKTNRMALVELLGPETDAWRGEQVELQVVPVQFGGRTVKGIRIAKA